MLFEGHRIEEDLFEQTDVCIVGGSLAAVGLAIRLARAQVRVVLLEHEPLPDQPIETLLVPIPSDVQSDWLRRSRRTDIEGIGLQSAFQGFESGWSVQDAREAGSAAAGRWDAALVHGLDEGLPVQSPGPEGSIGRAAGLLGLKGRTLPRLQLRPAALLEAASRAGVRVFTGIRVRRLLTVCGQASGVEAWFWDRETSAPKHRLDLGCPVVVIGASSPAAPRLLRQNRLGGVSIGQETRFQLLLRVTGVFQGRRQDLPGSDQGWLLDAFRKDGFLLQVLAQQQDSAVLGLHLLPSMPVVFRKDRPHFSLDRRDGRSLVQGLATAAELLFAAGASSVRLPLGRGETLHRPEEIDRFARRQVRFGQLADPLPELIGGCALGWDPRQSVADWEGEVHGVEGLFVAGSSTLPGLPEVPPAFPAMTTAFRSMSRILRRIGR